MATLGSPSEDIPVSSAVDESVGAAAAAATHPHTSDHMSVDEGQEMEAAAPTG